MATAYIVHSESDLAFVQQNILPVLPSNGFDFWLSSTTEGSTQPAERCALVIIVLSSGFADSADAVEKLETALAGRNSLIVALTDSAVKETSDTKLPVRVWALPLVVFGKKEKEKEKVAQHLLADMLPPVDLEQENAAPESALRIEWNDEQFSDFLRTAISRRDYPRAEELVSAIVSHLKYRPYSYPARQASNDLNELRKDRRFKLMQRYGESVINSGTRQDTVLRLHAQALIEIGHYEQALELLKAIINDPLSEMAEVFEAQGLTGRVFKQRYVNAPGAPGAESLLWLAVDAYMSAYRADSNNFWHGVNAASCMLRAHRDFPGVDRGPAEKIALQIVHDLQEISQEHALPIWDNASLVEALLALERYDEADKALDAYINHPEMTAFEVTSTFRQFDQVLQLGSDELGKRLLERLRNAMLRLRVTWSAARRAEQTLETGIEGGPFNHMIIRLSTPDLDPAGFPGLTIHSQLGTIVTARGNAETVSALLSHPSVISVEESQPAGFSECERSLPFIKVGVNAEYVTATGSYTEQGDAALIAFIDDGIDIQHEAFLDSAGNSRIIGIWDQTDAKGAPPAGFGYGKFYDAATISGFIKEPDSPLPIGLRRMSNDHGTHVASIAGGRAAGEFAGGVAPDARLLVVVSAATGPTGYSQSHIDALAFVDRFATDHNLPVVVNVSQGMNAGAHDGMSSLEAAFDAFSGSGRVPGRAVVKSAGNERGKGGHAKVTMLADAAEDLTWKRQKGADYFDRIELWCSSADDFLFRLREPVSPGSEPEYSEWVGTANPECSGTFPKGGPFRLTFIKRHIDNGDSLLMVELGNATAPAGDGDWMLDITSGAIGGSGEVHAWIERNQGLPSIFLSHVDEEMTLSVPGTARSVISVAAVDASQPIKVGSFSSYGPTRDNQKKPTICAPGVNVVGAGAGSGNGVLQLTGTSMAAPHVAGAIALLLSRAAKQKRIPGSNQIASALTQKTQNGSGRWDRGQGYGVIDVSALLAAFD